MVGFFSASQQAKNSLGQMAGPCRQTQGGEKCASCILDTTEYFKGLSLAAKRELQAMMRLSRFARHEMLHAEGQPAERFCILMHGEAKEFRALPDGRHQIHKLAVIPGEVIGCQDMFLETYGSSVEAITPVTACCLKRQDLLAGIARYPEVGLAMLRTMARDLNACIRHIANLGQKQAVERLAAYLVYLQETQAGRVLDHGVLSEALSRMELADLLGMTPRTLIRSLRDLEHRRIISLARGGFVIRSPKELERLGAGGA
jgi:CRP/FNR family transcriptional regulator